MITFSIGQGGARGAVLAATFALVNRYFKECVLLLGDTLQADTLALTNYRTYALTGIC